ncbi:MAG: CarD family transcriptional regulator [Micavibrio sp.]|nr:CarD family transcriptional regulator [Micavibrio sp.]
MAKITKAKAKPTKKPAATTTTKTAATKKQAPAAKAAAPAAKVNTAPAAKATPATAVKVTMKGKTAVKVAPPAAVKAKAPVAAPVAVKSKPEAKAPEAAPVAAAPAAPKKQEKLDFGPGDFVVYPAHGVGLVEGVETTSIAGMEITLYTICFEKDRMRLKLPISKVKSSGLRKLSSKDRLKDALATLQGRSQTRRVMWSRRAQEYEAKINSGDPVAIAEVLRDLRKDTDESEQSYSERQIYQAALERLAREVAAIEKIDEKKAAEKLEAVLSNVA